MNTSPKKPSPLSYGSARTSPFKRPSSPHSNSPSTAPQHTVTPQSPPTQQPQYRAPPSPVPSTSPAPTSNQRRSSSNSHSNSSTPHKSGNGMNSDMLGKLPPAQVREMRECFQVLDRDNDGNVTRDDVADILNQLGLDNSNQSLSQYFPSSSSSSSSMNLATYLSMLASLCGDLSRTDELTAAFAAFDVDDSGQIDLEELRDALLNTPPEKGETALSARDIDKAVEGFTARRAFGKNANMNAGKPRGEVFRYLDFVGTLSGKGGDGAEGHKQQQQPQQQQSVSVSGS